MDLRKNMNQSVGEWGHWLSAFWRLLAWAPTSSRRREVFCLGSLFVDETGFLKQGIPAVLACSVKGATQNLISNTLAEPAVQVILKFRVAMQHLLS